jgi:ribosome-associated translation inhibitor RaiA
MVWVDGETGRFVVVFHNADPSDAVRSRAEQLLERLHRFQPGIMHGTLTIEARHKHHHQGRVYHVSVNLHLPGYNVIVSHDPELNHAHEDVYVAMRDACEAARRQLEAYSRFTGKGTRHQKHRFEGNPRNSRDINE